MLGSSMWILLMLSGNSFVVLILVCFPHLMLFVHYITQSIPSFFFFFVSFLFFTYHPIFIDLRDDKQFFVDHPGAVPISTAQVRILSI